MSIIENYLLNLNSTKSGAMKSLLKFYPFLLLLLVFTACDKENNKSGDDDQFITYHGLVCGANPSFCYADSNMVSAVSFFAELSPGVSQPSLLIDFDGKEIRVDFNGIDDYSSDSTNLNVSVCFYDGGLNPCYSSASSVWTGAYMEILAYDNEFIEGNFRFIASYYDPIGQSTKYTGADYGLFKIKLR